MRYIFFTLLSFIPFFSFAQSTNTIEAPIGFLRDAPNVTANIVVRIPENDQVNVVEIVGQNWLKVEYIQDGKKIVGYITSQTVGEVKFGKGKRIAMGPYQ